MSQKPEFKVMVMFTPPKINIEPENDGLEDDVPLPGVSCQVHVNLPGCIRLYIQIHLYFWIV